MSANHFPWDEQVGLQNETVNYSNTNNPKTPSNLDWDRFMPTLFHGEEYYKLVGHVGDGGRLYEMKAGTLISGLAHVKRRMDKTANNNQEFSNFAQLASKQSQSIPYMVKITRRTSAKQGNYMQWLNARRFDAWAHRNANRFAATEITPQFVLSMVDADSQAHFIVMHRPKKLKLSMLNVAHDMRTYRAVEWVVGALWRSGSFLQNAMPGILRMTRGSLMFARIVDFSSRKTLPREVTESIRKTYELYSAMHGPLNKPFSTQNQTKFAENAWHAAWDMQRGKIQNTNTPATTDAKLLESMWPLASSAQGHGGGSSRFGKAFLETFKRGVKRTLKLSSGNSENKNPKTLRLRRVVSTSSNEKSKIHPRKFSAGSAWRGGGGAELLSLASGRNNNKNNNKNKANVSKLGVSPATTPPETQTPPLFSEGPQNTHSALRPVPAFAPTTITSTTSTTSSTNKIQPPTNASAKKANKRATWISNFISEKISAANNVRETIKQTVMSFLEESGNTQVTDGEVFMKTMDALERPIPAGMEKTVLELLFTERTVKAGLLQWRRTKTILMEKWKSYAKNTDFQNDANALSILVYLALVNYTRTAEKNIVNLLKLKLITTDKLVKIVDEYAEIFKSFALMLSKNFEQMKNENNGRKKWIKNLANKQRNYIDQLTKNKERLKKFKDYDESTQNKIVNHILQNPQIGQKAIKTSKNLLLERHTNILDNAIKRSTKHLNNEAYRGQSNNLKNQLRSKYVTPESERLVRNSIYKALTQGTKNFSNANNKEKTKLVLHRFTELL
jgi:hypothetical protein